MVAVFGLPHAVVGQRFIADIGLPGNHFTNTENILFRIVETGDDRRADQHRKIREVLEYVPDVLEDQFAAPPRGLLVAG